MPTTCNTGTMKSMDNENPWHQCHLDYGTMKSMDNEKKLVTF